MDKELNNINLLRDKFHDEWSDELFSFWRKNLWTEASLDEYCLFKVWCIWQGDNYFTSLQKHIQKEMDKTIGLDAIKHDSWTMFKASLGIDTERLSLRILSAMNKNNENFTTQEGGIA